MVHVDTLRRAMLNRLSIVARHASGYPVVRPAPWFAARRNRPSSPPGFHRQSTSVLGHRGARIMATLHHGSTPLDPLPETSVARSTTGSAGSCRATVPCGGIAVSTAQSLQEFCRTIGRAAHCVRDRLYIDVILPSADNSVTPESQIYTAFFHLAHAYEVAESANPTLDVWVRLPFPDGTFPVIPLDNDIYLYAQESEREKTRL